jgi:hypothetical protein
VSADPLAATGGLVAALLTLALPALRCSLLGRPSRFGLGGLATDFKLIGVLVALAVALAGCGKKATKGPAAGLYAVRGGGKVTREFPSFLRSPRPGMTLSFDMVLELEQEAVLEGLNGAYVALGDGRHKVASLNALYLPPQVTRRVIWLSDVAQERDIGSLVEASRYEPLESGKPLKTPQADSFADNAAFLFMPQGKPAEPERPTGAPPPWMGAPGFIRPLHRPLADGDGMRALASADGAVVVEFEDRATALTSELKLPLDLVGVKRVVVVRGRARFLLPDRKTAEARDGQVVEVAPLP